MVWSVAPNASQCRRARMKSQAKRHRSWTCRKFNYCVYHIAVFPLNDLQIFHVIVYKNMKFFIWLFILILKFVECFNSFTSINNNKRTKYSFKYSLISKIFYCNFPCCVSLSFLKNKKKTYVSIKKIICFYVFFRTEFTKARSNIFRITYGAVQKGRPNRNITYITYIQLFPM